MERAGDHPRPDRTVTHDSDIAGTPTKGGSPGAPPRKTSTSGTAAAGRISGASRTHARSRAECQPPREAAARCRVHGEAIRGGRSAHARNGRRGGLRTVAEVAPARPLLLADPEPAGTGEAGRRPVARRAAGGATRR